MLDRAAAILIAALLPACAVPVRDNALTGAEVRGGWILLFDGETLGGWRTTTGKPIQRSVDRALGAINPRGCGDYMVIHEERWSDFILSLDFRIDRGTNSGIFLRTHPLEPRPGKDVGYNGIEVAIDDTPGAGYHDTGAIYDLAKPLRNAMRPAGEWNRIEITCDLGLIAVVLNGEEVTRIDLDRFTEPFRRPDGTEHKFDFALRDHPRRGYIGLQDHGGQCWFKNIRIRPLRAAGAAGE